MFFIFPKYYTTFINRKELILFKKYIAQAKKRKETAANDSWGNYLPAQFVCSGFPLNCCIILLYFIVPHFYCVLFSGAGTPPLPFPASKRRSLSQYSLITASPFPDARYLLHTLRWFCQKRTCRSEQSASSPCAPMPFHHDKPPPLSSALLCRIQSLPE